MVKTNCLIFTLCLAISTCLLFSATSSQSIDVIERSNGSMILLCNIQDKSTEIISYKWYIDHDKLIVNDKYHDVKGKGKELHVKKLKNNGAHYYICVIELRRIGAKFAVYKKIQNQDIDLKLYRHKRNRIEALKFTTKMMPNKNFELGSIGKIPCKATGNTNIYWKRNQDEELPDNVEDVNGTLILNNINVEMKGIYTCVATSDKDQITHQLEIRILPTFEIAPPKKMTINEQQSVMFDCVGSESPTINWDYETNMIKTDERFQIYDNGSLFIQDVRVDDGGSYGCTIGNSAGFKRVESYLIVEQLDSPNSDEPKYLLSNKAVLITCSFAIFYIIGVIVLMVWCRQRRGIKQRDGTDPEQLRLDEENDQHDEKASSSHKKLMESLSSSFTFDIRFEKIVETKKIGIDNNTKMEILTGLVGDSDLPVAKVVEKDNHARTDEIKLQLQTKVLIRTIKRDQDLKDFRRLIDLYCTIDSVNVVKLMGLSKETTVYGMILEHSDDLKSYLVEKTEMPSNILLEYCHQLGNAVNSIHAMQLIHRDISLSNLNVTRENILKLTSKAPTDSGDCFEYNNVAFRLSHTAPEIILSCENKSEIKYSFASDIYAYGITLWEIFNKGDQPFKSLGKEDIIKKLQTKSLDYNLLGTLFSADVNDMMLKCLNVNDCDRISSHDIIDCLEEASSKMNRT